MLILTHNYPSGPKDNSGIWIKRLWEGEEVMKISIGFGLLRSLRQLRRGKGLIIAYWIIPAGILAWLSGRPYILNCVGLDVFIVCRSRLLSFLFRPILNKACKLIFIGGFPMQLFRDRYGDRYARKMHLIYLPVSSKEFYPA